MTKADVILAKKLGFRISGSHVEFLEFKEDKILVKAVRPAEEWQVALWTECVSLTSQIG